MVVRGKFFVYSVTKFCGPQESADVVLSAVTGGANEVEENKRYHKYTPSGELKMRVDNPAVIGEFVPGREFYLDFIPAEEVK